MSTLRAAVDWLIRQEIPWSAGDAASIADLPEDRAKAYLRRLVVDQVVVISADGGLYRGGVAKAITAWRREARRPTGEGGNSAAYKRARAAREAVLARRRGSETGGALTWQEATPADSHGQEATMGQQAGPGGLVTVEAVSLVLGVSTRTVERMIRRGEVRALRVGRLVRIPMSEVDRITTEGTGPVVGATETEGKG
ncbi:MAG: Helix-turn-helix domain [Planctomycetota bacterium]|jgi:excisionase family DNA binding protein